MAESPLSETFTDDGEHETDEPDELADKPPISQFAARLSDRAIQRITGGNAFLRGRIYARRSAVDALEADGHEATAQILVRNAEEPYKIGVEVDDAQKITSSCTCPGWRGPTGHCKHVAALLVALRDRERPPRAKLPDPNRKKNGAPPLHVPQTVSVGGKRRRSRRRRRGAGSNLETPVSKIEVLSARELPGAAPAPTHDRGSLDTWLPSGAIGKPYEFEYRLAVRAASIAVTPVLAGTRSAVPIVETLAGFNLVSAHERPTFRALARHTRAGSPRPQSFAARTPPSCSRFCAAAASCSSPPRWSCASPTSRSRPRVELDLANDEAVRVRVVFESAAAGGSRCRAARGSRARRAGTST